MLATGLSDKKPALVAAWDAPHGATPVQAGEEFGSSALRYFIHNSHFEKQFRTASPFSLICPRICPYFPYSFLIPYSTASGRSCHVGPSPTKLPACKRGFNGASWPRGIL